MVNPWRRHHPKCLFGPLDSRCKVHQVEEKVLLIWCDPQLRVCTRGNYAAGCFRPNCRFWTARVHCCVTHTLAQPLYCMCVLLRGGFLNLSKILHEIRGNQRKLEEGGRSGFCENMHCFSLSACGRRPYDAPSAKSYYAHLQWWEVSMPSHLIHTWCLWTPRLECQVISAAPSCKFVTSTTRAPNTCAYVRFPEPSSAKRACQRLQYPRPRPCLPGCATHGMTWNVMHTISIPNLCKCANTWIFVLAHRLSGGMEYWSRSTTLCCSVPDISYTLEKSPPTSSPFVVAHPTSDLGLARYICNPIQYPNTLLVAQKQKYANR